MTGPRRRGWGRVRTVLHVAVVMSMGLTTSAVAQEGCIPNVTCPRPSPTPTPAATTAPTTQPKATATPKPKVPVPTKAAVPKPTVPAVEELLPTPTAKSGPSRTIPPGFKMPVIARTPGRNTIKLVELLKPLARDGVTLEQVLVAGMGRFPVAGIASYSDDWMNPRFTPTFHLHEGLDIFADFGTPIRAPDKGVVTRLSDGASGGIGIWTRGSDGTNYYFAHLQARVKGIHVGMPVKTGQVIGFVGDSGNARGGAPHLHFEILRPHEIPPKPSVDRWLDQAIKAAPGWVKAQQNLIRQNKRPAFEQVPSAAPEASDLETTMLLTVLDPVGGAVGLVPRLELAHNNAPVSTHLLNDLIRQRLDGYMLVPGSESAFHRD